MHKLNVDKSRYYITLNYKLSYAHLPLVKEDVYPAARNAVMGRAVTSLKKEDNLGKCMIYYFCNDF